MLAGPVCFLDLTKAYASALLFFSLNAWLICAAFRRQMQPLVSSLIGFLIFRMSRKAFLLTRSPKSRATLREPRLQNSLRK